jgi:predicted transcriptional regulator
MIEGKAKLAVKLPIELDQWIEKQAEMEERSKNAIVVRALRAVKQAQEKAPAQ